MRTGARERARTAVLPYQGAYGRPHRVQDASLAERLLAGPQPSSGSGSMGPGRTASTSTQMCELVHLIPGEHDDVLATLHAMPSRENGFSSVKAGPAARRRTFRWITGPSRSTPSAQVSGGQFRPRLCDPATRARAQTSFAHSPPGASRADCRRPQARRVLPVPRARSAGSNSCRCLRNRRCTLNQQIIASAMWGNSKRLLRRWRATWRNAVRPADPPRSRPEPDSVGESLAIALRLADEERQRAQTLSSKSATLAGFSAATLALVAQFGRELFKLNLGQVGNALAPVFFLASVAALAAAGALALFGALRPRKRIIVTQAAIEDLTTFEWLSKQKWEIQGELLATLVHALIEDRRNSDRRARYTNLATWALLAGILATACLAGTLGLHEVGV